jgi:RNA recognition motif-containing protein
MKLMVLNLPRDFRKQDVAEMFKAYGNIRGCDLVLDEETGKSKGFAFVEMALEHDGD